MSDKEHRNMKISTGLEIGLRPELGTYELCDKHYDASKTESEAHCAVCKLEQQLAELREGIAKHKDSFNNPDDYTGEDIDLWALLQESSDE